MRQMLSNEHVLWWMRQHPRRRYCKFDVGCCPLALYMRGNGYPRAQWGVESGVLDNTVYLPLGFTGKEPDPNRAFADNVLHQSIFGFSPVPDRGNLGMVAEELAKRMGVA